jgi:hypothetical protein
MVIKHLQAAHAKAGLPLVEVNLEGVVFHLDHPEHVVRVDVHVEVVDLCGDREVGRSNRNGVQVKSNEGECTPMELPVGTNELARGKAHVGSVR